ncbi:hypothetical protein EDD18DRAFT_1109536 [Armillaria luteobubalina]|uniref:Uncharacterized protein n=1 Tax=Armillaria luteobubalina TaxID=153913 RepID=A0AA39PWD5_9AGAR|nr:hypothetical protein EDD18DRAFT_1109536 [Armillaria luteobubalina]
MYRTRVTKPSALSCAGNYIEATFEDSSARLIESGGRVQEATSNKDSDTLFAYLSSTTTTTAMGQEEAGRSPSRSRGMDRQARICSTDKKQKQASSSGLLGFAEMVDVPLLVPLCSRQQWDVKMIWFTKSARLCVTLTVIPMFLRRRQTREAPKAESRLIPGEWRRPMEGRDCFMYVGATLEGPSPYGALSTSLKPHDPSVFTWGGLSENVTGRAGLQKWLTATCTVSKDRRDSSNV